MGKSIDNLPKDICNKLKNSDFEPTDYAIFCKTSNCEHESLDKVFDKTDVAKFYPKSIFRIGWYVFEKMLGIDQQDFMLDIISEVADPDFNIGSIIKHITKLMSEDYVEEFSHLVSKEIYVWKLWLNRLDGMVKSKKSGYTQSESMVESVGWLRVGTAEIYV